MVQMRPFFSWFSLMAVAAGQVFQKAHIYTWGVWEKFCLRSQPELLGTMDTFFAIMRWSFESMVNGTWPSHDWRGCRFPKKSKEGKRAGKPLANGWRGCLGLQDGVSTTSHAPFARRLNSGWQSSTLTPTTFRSHFSPACPLFQLPGVTSLTMAMDWMHCHHLAWLHYLFVSIIHMLVFYLPICFQMRI